MFRSLRWYGILLLLAGICILAGMQHRNGQAPVQAVTPAAPVPPGTEAVVPTESDPPPVTEPVTEAAAVPAAPAAGAEPEAAVPEPEDASLPQISAQKSAEITAKMDAVSAVCSDLIGWLYVAESAIDYPVVQGTDNQYYLHHAPDGRENRMGSIFLDAQCAGDFSDKQNILYGHNMQRGMFGDIRALKAQAQFDHYRYGWLFTQESVYRIEFYALVIVSAGDALYVVPADGSAWQDAVRENSLYFREEAAGSPEDCRIALSTCASDFENARALWVGKLQPVPDGSAF